MSRTARALILAGALALAGCASLDLSSYRTAVLESGDRVSRPEEVPVVSGQIIVNEHPTGTSLFLSLITDRSEPYTHAGIVVAEPDGAWVYESMGAMLPLPWRPPNASVGGGVQRVSLSAFLARGGITAIYEPPPQVDRAALVEFAREMLREHKPFDSYYDPREPSKYYCVEFVARALEHAGAPPYPGANTTSNPSMRVALDWLSIRTPQMLLAGDLVAGQRRVALFSQRFTDTEVSRYFELKREIHRRFTDDQRIGNVVSWKRQRLRMRPVIDRFFEEGVSSTEAPALLAERILGRWEE